MKCFCFAFALTLAGWSAAKSCAADIESLTNGPPSAIKSATEAVLAERRQIENALFDILRNRPSDELSRARFAAATRIAGEWRIEKVVEPLLNNIDFCEGGVFPATRPLDPRTDYISIAALIRIGMPSVIPAIDRISQVDSADNRPLYVLVIHEILGYDLAQAALEGEIRKREFNHENVTSLKAGLDYLQKRLKPQ